MLPIIFQIDDRNWLVITLCISSWVNCMGPHRVRIGNKLEGCPLCIVSMVCCYIIQ